LKAGEAGDLLAHPFVHADGLDHPYLGRGSGFPGLVDGDQDGGRGLPGALLTREQGFDPSPDDEVGLTGQFADGARQEGARHHYLASSSHSREAE